MKSPAERATPAGEPVGNPGTELRDLARAVLAGRPADLSAVRALFAGDPGDPLASALRRAGARLTCWHPPAADTATARAVPGARLATRDFDRPWIGGTDERDGPLERFDVVVARGVLARAADSRAVLALLAQLAPVVCVDYDPDRGGRGRADLAPAPGAEPPARNGRAWIETELAYLDFHVSAEDVEPAGSAAPMVVAECFDLAMRRSSTPNRSPLLVHVHVPKNGGTSINNTLDQSFGHDHLPLYFEDPARRHTHQSLAYALIEHPDIQAISSHSIRLYPPTIAGRNALYFCFMRDPVERHLSYWRYCRKNYTELSEEHRIRWLPADFMDMDLDRFLRWQADFDERFNVTANRQVHYFARTANVRLAIDTLRRFFFIGLTEQLERGLELLRRKLDPWGMRLELPDSLHHNVTADAANDAAAPDPEQHPYLQKLDADRALYDWARENFEREAAQWGV